MGNEVSAPEEDPTSAGTMRLRPGVQLCELPSELILKICTHLPPPDLLNLQLVSSFLRAFVTDRKALQYALACHRYSVLPTPHADGEGFQPVADRLEALERSEANWEGRGRGRDWARMQCEGESTIYELQSSVFVRGTSYQTPHPHSALQQGLRPASIELHPFPTSPSTSTPIDSTEPYSTVDFGLGPFLDLTLDPGQNLIVLATRTSNGSQPGMPPAYAIHLRDMEGKPHPEAKMEVLPVDVVLEGQGEVGVGEGVESGRMLLQVLEGTLACLVSNTVSEAEGEVVFVWDWRTGEMKSRTPIPESLVYPSISLLTPTSFLILAFNVNLALICPQITLYHLHSPAAILGLSLDPPYPFPTPSPATELETLFFPSVHRTALSRPIMLLDIRPDPPSSNTARVHPHGRTRSHTLDPECGVLEFDLMAGGRLFGFHFLRDPLIASVHTYERRAQTGELGRGEWGGKILPREWRTWGEEACRVMETTDQGQRAWVTFVEGYRTLTRLPTRVGMDGRTRVPHVVLRDFAPKRMPRRSERQESKAGSKETAEAGPSAQVRPSVAPTAAPSADASPASWLTVEELADLEASAVDGDQSDHDVDDDMPSLPGEWTDVDSNADDDDASGSEANFLDSEDEADIIEDANDEPDGGPDLNDIDLNDPIAFHAAALIAGAAHATAAQNAQAARDRVPPVDPNEETRYISRDEPTIIPTRRAGAAGNEVGQQAFAEEVVSRLPYREGHVPLPGGLGRDVGGGLGGGLGVMLDAGNVVVTERRNETDPWTFHIMPM